MLVADPRVRRNSLRIHLRSICYTNCICDCCKKLERFCHFFDLVSFLKRCHDNWLAKLETLFSMLTSRVGLPSELFSLRVKTHGGTPFTPRSILNIHIAEKRGSSINDALSVSIKTFFNTKYCRRKILYFFQMGEVIYR